MFNKIKPVISAADAKALVPLPNGLTQEREKVVRTIENIICGKDKRKLFIVGPCSADNENAAVDYAVRLARVAEAVADKIYIVMRVFTSKPRTRGEGYMGMIHTPNPTSCETDINAGIVAARRTHIRVVQMSGLFTADELLYPDAVEYTDDILAYMTVGARSAEDQTHRFVASGVDVPVGIKNPINGNLQELASSIHAVRLNNEFMFGGMQVKTDGNEFAHAILRGAVNDRGENIPNYEYDNVMSLNSLCENYGIHCPAVIIDTGHSNSGKRTSEVGNILSAAVEISRKYPDYNRLFKGAMIESYIEEGSQPPGGGVYGKSITDPCLGFEQTKDMIFRAAERIVL
ncbi:MAG: 3-deoxy-7-phosphoheptulonate synthase [Clostridiales bacterium]|nr:3-deoxy-7-phosphoheptulonate synthase [Clostridiales bacterium]